MRRESVEAGYCRCESAEDGSAVAAWIGGGDEARCPTDEASLQTVTSATGAALEWRGLIEWRFDQEEDHASRYR